MRRPTLTALEQLWADEQRYAIAWGGGKIFLDAAAFRRMRERGVSRHGVESTVIALTKSGEIASRFSGGCLVVETRIKPVG